MKLTSIVPQPKIDPAQVKPNESKAEARNAAGPTHGGDQVNLSADAQDIQRIKEILAQTPEVRLEKVKSFKAQIERGEYRVDASTVADRMLQTMLSDQRLK
ncbi:MAG: flagellar biosynthesis anti-sigma factor FlgM [Desulfobulbaceae bacterium]|nr:MAG: flagellar biosynthesis anti-sigma factor FlgM [Desulfobulbaceae bacterium]